MSDKLRYGLVGAGRIAQAYADAFETSETARLAAVADVRAEAAEALAERLGCRSYASRGEMAGAEGLDAVVVCTPPATHRDVAVDFLSRGVHVLCEKPLSTGRADAREMLDAAERGGALLTMASKFRFVEDVVRAHSIVASGVLGEVVLFENAFASRVDMRGRWNSDPRLSGGGVLIDNGTHSVDLLRYFLGPLAAVQVVECRRGRGLCVEETVRLSVRSEGGVVGGVDLSWGIDKELPSFINVYGTDGTVSVGWKESKYRLASGREWVVFGAGYDKAAAFRGQIDNFSRAVRGEEPLRVTPADALASVEVIEAAYAALARDSWVPVGNPTRGEAFAPHVAGGTFIEETGAAA